MRKMGSGRQVFRGSRFDEFQVKGEAETNLSEVECIVEFHGILGGITKQ